MFPYLVIDQNQLRRADAIADAVSRCQNDDLQLLVPDGAGFELSKSSDVFDTWQNSCELIAPHSNLLVASRKMTDMMRTEIRIGQPIDSLADTGATEVFRGILDDFANGDESSLRQLVEGPVKDKMPASLNAWSDCEAHRSMISQMRDMLKEMLSDEAVKRLRRSPESEFASWLSSTDGMWFVFQKIRLHGETDVSALRLASAPSVTGAFISSLAAVALYWLAFGGLETVNPEKVTNDLHDIEYAVLGSLSVGLLSADKRLQNIHEAVKSAQASRHRRFKDQLDAS